MDYSNINTSVDGPIATIELNRPEVYNAISSEMITELEDVLTKYEDNETVRVLIISGGEAAFASGVDIAQMQAKGKNFISQKWRCLEQFSKPVIAAVSGHALGGGCELAMMCDIIIAGESARFAQPEINLGIMPGIGGTQRLPRLVGRAKAMDMCLTGRVVTAEEAEREGLISRVVPDAELMVVAHEVAKTIAEKSVPSLKAVKQAVRLADELPLAKGLAFEQDLFQALFDTNDQAEGMAAFMQKRKPEFKDK